MRYIHLAFACLFVVLLPLTACRAQNEKIEIVGDGFSGKQMYFLSEMHTGEERGAFTEAMVRYMVTQQGVTNIVRETSVSEAYLMNRYLHHDDTTIFRYYPDDKLHRSLDGLRSLNETLPASKKITIYGMDFERAEFVVAVKRMLELHEGGRNTNIYRYLDALPDSFYKAIHVTIEQRQQRKEILGRARKIALNEQKLLEHILKEDYQQLRRITENPTSEFKFSLRDQGMCRNIRRQLNGQPFLCIVGSYHTSYHRKQLFPSLIKRLVKSGRGNKKKMVIVDEVFCGMTEANMLFSHDGDSMRYEYRQLGPRYFLKNDSAMALAYRKYHTPGTFQLVNRMVFKDLVPQSNHGLDSYYVFFGEAPKPGTLDD